MSNIDFSARQLQIQSPNTFYPKKVLDTDSLAIFTPFLLSCEFRNSLYCVASESDFSIYAFIKDEQNQEQLIARLRLDKAELFRNLHFETRESLNDYEEEQLINAILSCRAQILKDEYGFKVIYSLLSNSSRPQLLAAMENS